MQRIKRAVAIPSAFSQTPRLPASSLTPRRSMEGPLAATRPSSCCCVRSIIATTFELFGVEKRTFSGLHPLVTSDPDETPAGAELPSTANHLSANQATMAAAPMTLLHYQGVLDAQQCPKVLGTGSIGTVYLYVDTNSGEQVAIKRIPIADLPYSSTAGALAHHLPRE